MNNEKVLGNTATVVFASMGGRGIEGKVDTGATTSSLHAEDIQMGQGKVRFRCPMLSNNFIDMPLDGAQEVHSADAGGNTRPIVSFDVEIDGIPIRGASFNLNDRGGMDSAVLIGQNILQSGGFIIDPSKNNEPQEQQTADVTESVDNRADQVAQAVAVLIEHNVSLSELMTHFRTVAVKQSKD